MRPFKRLENYLHVQTTASVKLTFDQMEGILGVPLPPEAVCQPEWWSNTVIDGSSPAMGWLPAFRRVSRVVPGEGVTFVRCRLSDPDFSVLRL
ncbi:hypothetical protein PV433_23085 [Paenibacillus sp. GYB004]|uniref:DUF7662 domain-containing protein n=1 Tax=Paenibacillus sp. GYB004 TaxID=2994393 RepID=UPI002F9660B0